MPLLLGKKEEEGIDTSPWQPACPVIGVCVAEHGRDRVECNVIVMGRDIERGDVCEKAAHSLSTPASR